MVRTVAATTERRGDSRAVPRGRASAENQVKRLCRYRRWLRLNEGVYLVDADVLEGEPRGRR